MARKAENNEPDVCHYCGKQYHPMGVYTKGYVKRWVCELEFVQDEYGQFTIKVVDKCKNIALAEGFVFNRRLTPRR